MSACMKGTCFCTCLELSQKHRPNQISPPGSDVYADIAGWHLYLRDLNAAPGVKMADVLAHQLGQVCAMTFFAFFRVPSMCGIVESAHTGGGLTLPPNPPPQIKHTHACTHGAQLARVKEGFLQPPLSPQHTPKTCLRTFVLQHSLQCVAERPRCKTLTRHPHKMTMLRLQLASSEEGFTKAGAEGVLQRLPVPLGKGKLQVALSDLLPTSCTNDLMRLVEDFARGSR